MGVFCPQSGLGSKRISSCWTMLVYKAEVLHVRRRDGVEAVSAVRVPRDARDEDKARVAPGGFGFCAAAARDGAELVDEVGGANKVVATVADAGTFSRYRRRGGRGTGCCAAEEGGS